MALANQDNSRRVYLQRDYLQSRITKSGAVTWFHNGGAVIIPRPEGKKAEQFPENRETWEGQCGQGIGPPGATSQEGSQGHVYPDLPVLRGLPACCQGPHCRNPAKSQRTEEPLDVIHTAQPSRGRRPRWGRVECRIGRSEQDPVYLAQIPTYGKQDLEMCFLWLWSSEQINSKYLVLMRHWSFESLTFLNLEGRENRKQLTHQQGRCQSKGTDFYMQPSHFLSPLPLIRNYQDNCMTSLACGT